MSDWKEFFKAAEPYAFQASKCNDGRQSIGSMETIYQAFKARMQAENYAGLSAWYALDIMHINEFNKQRLSDILKPKKRKDKGNSDAIDA